MNSPARRNPKNPRQKAAQSINLSRDGGLLDHVAVAWIEVSLDQCVKGPLSAYSRLGHAVKEGSG